MTREVVNREGRSPHWPEAGRDEGGGGGVVGAASERAGRMRCCWMHGRGLIKGHCIVGLIHSLGVDSVCVSRYHKQAESYGSARPTVPSFQMFLRKGMRGRYLGRLAHQALV